MRHISEQVFTKIHQVFVVAVRLVEFQHREFRIMAGGQPFVAKVAIDLEHLFETTNHQALQVQLGCDAQIHFHVQRVVVRDERLGCRAAGDRLKHRRFHFQIAVPDEEFAYRSDDPGARDEYFARVPVRDQIEIALAVFLLLVGQAVEFFRKRAQRLGQQPHLRNPHGKLTSLGLEQTPDSTDYVAEVVMFERIMHVLAGVVVADE